ncbi:hypothetical protein [Halalkalicoccus salilacus]|uniref:hypothetical protein n=1 Tax=Halalkalicoccus salilacus TaxID=3117459 RepID=UPI00300EC355
MVVLLDREGNEVARSGPVEGEPDEPIDVTVLDAETGDPIQGALVRGRCNFEGSTGEEDQSQETNEEGVATLLIPPSEGYTGCDFNINADGYESDSLRIGYDGVDSDMDMDDPEDVTVELTPTEDGDGETHTATVVVTDIDGVRLEGVDVDVNTYEAGEDVAEGTTDDCGEVQFDVGDGGYEVRASAEGLAQSSANMGLSVREDTTYVINLYDTDEYDGEGPRGRVEHHRTRTM